MKFEIKRNKFEIQSIIFEIHIFTFDIQWLRSIFEFNLGPKTGNHTSWVAMVTPSYNPVGPQSLYYRIICWPFCVVTMFLLLVKCFLSYDWVRSLPFPLFSLWNLNMFFFYFYFSPNLITTKLKLMNLRLIEFPRIKFEIQRKVFEFQSLIFGIQRKKFEFQRLKRGETEIFSWKCHEYACVVNMESK